MMCTKRGKRTTVLLGTGAALELSPEGIEWSTTGNITRSIVGKVSKRIKGV